MTEYFEEMEIKYQTEKNFNILTIGSVSLVKTEQSVYYRVAFGKKLRYKKPQILLFLF